MRQNKNIPVMQVMKDLKAAKKMDNKTSTLLSKTIFPIKNEFIKPTPLFY